MYTQTPQQHYSPHHPLPHLLRPRRRRAPTPLLLHLRRLQPATLLLLSHPLLLSSLLHPLLSLSSLARLPLTLTSLLPLPPLTLPLLSSLSLILHPLRRNSRSLPFLLRPQHLRILHRRTPLHPLHPPTGRRMHSRLPLRIP